MSTTDWNITFTFNGPNQVLNVQMQIPAGFIAAGQYAGRPEICEGCPAPGDYYEHTVAAEEQHGAPGGPHDFTLPYRQARPEDPPAEKKDITVYSAELQDDGKKKKMKSIKLGSIVMPT